MKQGERKDTRRGILANFQFSINGNAGEVFNGMTTDVSSDGFGFLTEVTVKEGQTLTVTKHALENLTGRRATVVWVKKKARCLEAGAQFHSEDGTL